MSRLLKYGLGLYAIAVLAPADRGGKLTPEPNLATPTPGSTKVNTTGPAAGSPATPSTEPLAGGRNTEAEKQPPATGPNTDPKGSISTPDNPGTAAGNPPKPAPDEDAKTVGGGARGPTITGAVATGGLEDRMMQMGMAIASLQARVNVLEAEARRGGGSPRATAQGSPDAGGDPAVMLGIPHTPDPEYRAKKEKQMARDREDAIEGANKPVMAEDALTDLKGKPTDRGKMLRKHPELDADFR